MWTIPVSLIPPLPVVECPPPPVVECPPPPVVECPPAEGDDSASGPTVEEDQVIAVPSLSASDLERTSTLKELRMRCEDLGIATAGKKKKELANEIVKHT